MDIEDFARFLGVRPTTATAKLLASGPGGARKAVLEYAVYLHRRGRAQATIDRRLATLRALVRTAHQRGLIMWFLEALPEHLVSVAMNESDRADSEHYFFPRNPSEIDRLDIQHYALKEAVGANFLAPVEEPARVLDVGCGTGQWAFETCQQFPAALVVGFDLVSGKLSWPSRYRLVRGNLLQGLPFRDHQFDFVHQRLLVSGVPVGSWPSVVTELVRVTRPGGWVELVEPPLGFEGAGQATSRLFALWKEIASELQLETASEVFDALDGYLREAGLHGIVRRQARVPVGEWGGRAGSLMMTDFRATSTRVCEMLQAQSRLTAEQAEEVIRGAQEEAEQRRMFWNIAIVFGQKPGRSDRT